LQKVQKMRTTISRTKLFLAVASVASIGIPFTAASAAGREVVVPIANMRFGAIPGGLKVGDTIVWKNTDAVPHTVTARDKSFDVRVNPRQSGRLTLTKAGAFPFYCIFHVQMRGTLTVAK
jgi:plastocyanin